MTEGTQSNCYEALLGKQVTPVPTPFGEGSVLRPPVICLHKVIISFIITRVLRPYQVICFVDRLKFSENYLFFVVETVRHSDIEMIIR